MVGVDKWEISSPASAIVDEGVLAPGPPVSGSVAASREGGKPPPGDVGGDDDLEVLGEAEESGLPDAVDESTDPAGLADRMLPGPVLALVRGTGTEVEGIRFPMSPLVSDTFLEPPTIAAVLGSSVGMRLPTSPR